MQVSLLEYSPVRAVAFLRSGSLERDSETEIYLQEVYWEFPAISACGGFKEAGLGRETSGTNKLHQRSLQIPQGELEQGGCAEPLVLRKEAQAFVV